MPVGALRQWQGRVVIAAKGAALKIRRQLMTSPGSTSRAGYPQTAGGVSPHSDFCRGRVIINEWEPTSRHGLRSTLDLPRRRTHCMVQLPHTSPVRIRRAYGVFSDDPP
jgi:hypothetical protein